MNFHAKASQSQNNEFNNQQDEFSIAKTCKTTFSLKIEIKKNYFLVVWHFIMKNYISPERKINVKFDKPNRDRICWIIHKLWVFLSFVLGWESYKSTFQWSYFQM